jgi:acetyl esterase/lipase
MVRKISSVLIGGLLLAGTAGAQSRALDVTSGDGTKLWLAMMLREPPARQWPLHFPEPPDDATQVTKNVTFATVDATSLRMDVYRPRAGKTALPALIFYALYWPSDGAPARESNDWYKAWGRIAAANGIVAIVPDLRAEPGTGTAAAPARAAGDDFQRLVSFLVEHASDYGVDAGRIAVFAESGATWAALPAVQAPSQTSVKAAVFYYGSANIETFRQDLPILWVRAGLDSPRTNADIARVSALGIAQNAPVTLVNYPGGHHGFEGRDAGAATRRIIEQTLEFVRSATLR